MFKREISLRWKFLAWIVAGFAIIVVVPLALQESYCSSKWLPVWLCGEAKLTDIAIAFFTYCLVIVGWFQLRSNEKTVLDLERAYVSGGGPNIGQQFIVTVDNYGKTPATLIEYAVEFCDVTKIPDYPLYDDVGYERIPCRANLKPTATFAIASHLIPAGIQNPVVYGRFWYEDIWKRRHSHGFILSLSSAALPRNISTAHTEWD
jgi:hypothetical protein